MSTGTNMRRNQMAENIRPDPDPTLLTTEQLLREISSLKEIVFTRLDGMDRAIIVFHENITRVPTDTDKQISHLRELVQETFKLTDEKFRSVQTQFTERDTRTEQTSRDSKVAVDAALQAAKEAVEKQNTSSALSISKSEGATGKQIDQLGTLIQSETRGLNDKIDDIKTRMTRIESEDKGQKAAVVTQQTSNVSLVSIIGLVIGTLIGIGGIVVGLMSHTP